MTETNDGQTLEKEHTLEKFRGDKRDNGIFAKIFDNSVTSALHTLAARGVFDVIEYVISTGKEAHVFRARTSGGKFLAIKIYKLETSDFKNMEKYIRGDERFKKTKTDRRGLVYEWTRKEFKNLERARECGVKVPLPIAFMKNILVLEFIGDEKGNAPMLKDCKDADYQAVYDKIIEYVARLVYVGKLVHADISEFNILMWNDEPVIIDIGQGVLTSHPRAKEFFDRDVENISRYFSKKGVEKSTEDVLTDLRKWKEQLEKPKKNAILP